MQRDRWLSIPPEWRLKVCSRRQECTYVSQHTRYPYRQHSPVPDQSTFLPSALRSFVQTTSLQPQPDSANCRTAFDSVVTSYGSTVLRSSFATLPVWTTCSFAVCATVQTSYHPLFIPVEVCFTGLHYRRWIATEIPKN
jgi:hypothetical protein